MSSGIGTRTSLTTPRSRAGCPTPTRFQTFDLRILLTCQSFVQAEGGYLEGLCENEMKVAQIDDDNDNDTDIVNN